MDAILDRPIEELLEGMPIEEDIKNALVGKESPLRDVYEYVLAYEQGRWDAVTELAERLNLNEAGVAELYVNTLERAGETLRELNPHASPAVAPPAG